MEIVLTVASFTDTYCIFNLFKIKFYFIFLKGCLLCEIWFFSSSHAKCLAHIKGFIHKNKEIKRHLLTSKSRIGPHEFCKFLECPWFTWQNCCYEGCSDLPNGKGSLTNFEEDSIVLKMSSSCLQAQSPIFPFLKRSDSRWHERPLLASQSRQSRPSNIVLHVSSFCWH